MPQEKDNDLKPADRSEAHARHAAPEGAGVDPLIDLNRDPTPGVPDHAKPED